MIRTKSRMLMEHFHDFYYLQALQAAIHMKISANPEQGFRPSVEKLQIDLHEYMDELYPNIALRSFVYLYAACLGESRHARSINVEDRFLTATLTGHRSDIFGIVSKFAPTQKNLESLVDVFAQKWASGFGGAAWRNIAEALLDYRARRPVMHLVDGVNTGLTWPAIELYLRQDRTGRELLFLTGPEPDHLWPSFARAVCDLAMEFDVRMLINLGAYPAAVPHTRPCHLTATATSAELTRQIAGYQPAQLTLCDNSEYNLYSIDLELAEQFGELRRRAGHAALQHRASVPLPRRGLGS